jgi:hypothetical protein
MLKNLEFVDAVFHYTKNRPFSQLTLQHFRDWLAATPKNKYKVLKVFMEKHISDRSYTDAQYGHMLFGVASASQAMDRIKKSSLKGAALIAYLNTRYSPNKFSFVNGELVIDQTRHRSKLSSLDGELSQIFGSCSY